VRLSFRKKAILFVITVLFLVSVAFTWQSIQKQKEITRNEVIKRSEVFTILAGKTGELAVLSKNEELLKNAARFMKSLSDVVFVVFYDNNMNLLVHEGISVPGPQVKENSDLSTVYVEKENYFDFFAPVYTERGKDDVEMFEDTGGLSRVKEKIGFVRIGFSKASMKAAERGMVVQGFVLALISIIVSGIITSAFITIITVPLTTLHGAVKRLAKGEYPEVKDLSFKGEIGELAEAFDTMRTAIKKRELQLIESERQLSNLFERLEHGIFRLDAEGKVLRTNRKFDEILGVEDEFFPFLSKKREETPLLKAAASGAVKDFEVEVLDKDGNRHLLLISIYPELDETRNIIAYEGYFVDVTEKKKLEESLMQAQKMESIGMLAGGIAHDFNNVLAGILGYASLLKSVTSENDKNYRYVENIEKSAERAASFTRQLVGFARKGKYIVAKLSVNDVVNELMKFLSETFDKNISITVEAKENLPLVEGDSNQLYQAVMNLCINARDAMPEGGKLFIKTDLYLLHEEKVDEYFQIPPGEYVVISVTDTGGGMTPEIKRHMFDPFYTTKDIGKGTGLGLAVVYGIIKNHGGYITVSSEAGRGTRVGVYLPKVDGVLEEKKKGETPARKTQGGTILIIDDEDLVRELGKDILETYNYDVLLAARGNEGIKIFNEKRDIIDLVILDMIMPEKSGKQVFYELKAIKADVKILLCSGYGKEASFQELLEAGASGLIKKPFQDSELVNEVKNILEG